ncbi:MAG: hypothetical protein QXG03_09220 [Halalkalicoccus sp.]
MWGESTCSWMYIYVACRHLLARATSVQRSPNTTTDVGGTRSGICGRVRIPRASGNWASTSPRASDSIGERLDVVRETLSEHDLPALAACGTIAYDPDSGLACLDDEREPFADRVRRAIGAGALTHRKPPQLKRHQQGVFY